MSAVSQLETRTAKASTPKKILLMGHTDGQGGAQTAFKKLCEFTLQEGHDVKIIVLSDSKLSQQPFQREELLGRIAYTGSRVRLAFKKTIGVLNVGIKAWRFRPDVFVCVGLNNSSNIVAKFLGKHCFKAGQDFIANRTIDDPTWVTSRKTMDGLVVQAPSMLAYWKQKESNATNINWLPCFPEAPVDGILQQRRNSSKVIIKLGYFGRLAGNKGLDLLLSALAEPGMPKNLRLDLWGKGQEEAALKRLTTELGIAPMVNFSGAYPSGVEGAKLMASYDGMVLCSTGMEGLPLILLESMAYGVPFLATNVGAIKDCCIDNPDAILVEPNQERIVEGLKQMITKIEQGQFNAQRHRTFYTKTFSGTVMGARWRAFYEDPKQFFYA
jgi:glycosyltransferase involved in cell wall biosynthesis